MYCSHWTKNSCREDLHLMSDCFAYFLTNPILVCSLKIIRIEKKFLPRVVNQGRPCCQQASLEIRPYLWHVRFLCESVLRPQMTSGQKGKIPKGNPLRISCIAHALRKTLLVRQCQECPTWQQYHLWHIVSGTNLLWSDHNLWQNSSRNLKKKDWLGTLTIN